MRVLPSNHNEPPAKLTVIQAIVDNPTLTAQAKMIAIAIVLRSDRNYEHACPGAGYLARAAAAKKTDVVWKVLPDLVPLGIVKFSRGNGHANGYEILPSRIIASVEEAYLAQRKPTPSRRVGLPKPTPSGGAGLSAIGTKPTPYDGAGSAKPTPSQGAGSHRQKRHTNPSGGGGFLQNPPPVAGYNPVEPGKKKKEDSFCLNPTAARGSLFGDDDGAANLPVRFDRGGITASLPTSNGRSLTRRVMPSDIAMFARTAGIPEVDAANLLRAELERWHASAFCGANVSWLPDLCKQALANSRSMAAIGRERNEVRGGVERPDADGMQHFANVEWIE